MRRRVPVGDESLVVVVCGLYLEWRDDERIIRGRTMSAWRVYRIAYYRVFRGSILPGFDSTVVSFCMRTGGDVRMGVLRLPHVVRVG